jgi:hypothetical protein
MCKLHEPELHLRIRVAGTHLMMMQILSRAPAWSFPVRVLHHQLHGHEICHPEKLSRNKVTAKDWRMITIHATMRLLKTTNHQTQSFESSHPERLLRNKITAKD